MFLRTERNIIWSTLTESEPESAAAAVPAAETLAGIVAKEGLPGIPDVSPEEELRQLLEAAAEVEHGLLTQYLGAVYSSTNQSIARIIRAIAIEEMGHLVTVQNLLVALGASPYLGRYDRSPDGHFVPFPYALEPVSRLSIAKYAACERPEDGQIDEEDKDVLPDILEDAKDVNPKRIGLLYAKIYWLLRENDDPLADPAQEAWLDFPVAEVAKTAPGRHVATYPVDASLTGQARADDWQASNARVIVDVIDSRAAALYAVARISAQGEGLANEKDGHFDTFVRAYREALTAGSIGLPFATSPWYAGVPVPGVPAAEITSQDSIDVAKLGDLLYEVTLLAIGVALDPKNGFDATRRSELAAYAIEVMRGAIAQLAFDMPELMTRHGGTTPLSLCFTLPQPPAGRAQARFETAVQEAVALASALAEREGLQADVRLAAEIVRDLLQQAPQTGGVVMAKRYRIHPGIGIARVGPSADGFFISGETRGAAPFELDSSGVEIAFRGYKDASFLIRPQGVRFRVFEYDIDPVTSAETLAREITAADATINWTVKLGNSKAAGPFMDATAGPQGEQIIVPSAGLRNPTLARTDLVTTATMPITGTALPPTTLTGTIMAQPVPLGAVGTDHAGRVVVVGSHGEAASWMNPAPSIDDYLNNDGWFDAISDGPVDAQVIFADGTTVTPDGSWVIVGPPDFAPGLHPLVSFYDVMADALGIAPARVSFENDVRPILQRAADLRWVNPNAVWRNLDAALQSINILADPNPDPISAAAIARRDARALVLRSEQQAVLRGFRLTVTQKTDILDRWVAGNFDSDLGVMRPMPLSTELDFVALSACIGSGFFPGIEIGFISMNPTLYSEACRFTRGTFDDSGVMRTLEAGMITQRMAVPWQADFMECAGVWWPPQRPDIIRFRADGTAAPANTRWDRGLVVGNTATPQSHRNMVDHFAKLGVIQEITAGGQRVFAEVGRKPAIP